MVNLKRIMAGIIAGATVVSMAPAQTAPQTVQRHLPIPKQRLMTRLKIRSALAI